MGKGTHCYQCHGCGHLARECPHQGKGWSDTGKGGKGCNSYGAIRTEKGGKSKGVRGPIGGCWLCGGAHYQSDSPKCMGKGKGNVSEVGVFSGWAEEEWSLEVRALSSVAVVGKTLGKKSHREDQCAENWMEVRGDRRTDGGRARVGGTRISASESQRVTLRNAIQVLEASAERVEENSKHLHVDVGLERAPRPPVRLTDFIAQRAEDRRGRKWEKRVRFEQSAKTHSMPKDTMTMTAESEKAYRKVARAEVAQMPVETVRCRTWGSNGRVLPWARVGGCVAETSEECSDIRREAGL